MSTINLDYEQNLELQSALSRHHFTDLDEKYAIFAHSKGLWCFDTDRGIFENFEEKNKKIQALDC